MSYEPRPHPHRQDRKTINIWRNTAKKIVKFVKTFSDYHLKMNLVEKKTFIKVFLQNAWIKWEGHEHTNHNVRAGLCK